MPGVMAAKINAVASKINAARELARRLAEQRADSGSKVSGQTFEIGQTL